jgi:hypothetical protein
VVFAPLFYSSSFSSSFCLPAAGGRCGAVEPIVAQGKFYELYERDAGTACAVLRGVRLS